MEYQESAISYNPLEIAPLKHADNYYKLYSAYISITNELIFTN